MVKVTSNLLTDEALRKMGITVVNGPNGSYNYYKTDVDKRNDSEFQQEITEDMENAAKIWAKKPGCWQDYFRRGRKFQTYGFGMDDQYGSSLTGYHLAIQILMDTLSHKDGTYHDPQCYCLHPVDMLGQKLGQSSNFHLSYKDKFDYLYDETHLLRFIDANSNFVSHPFCSASTIESIIGIDVKLKTDYTIPLQYGYGNLDPDFANIKEPVHYFPIKLEYPNLEYWYGVNIYDKNRWMYKKLGILDFQSFSGFISQVSDEQITEISSVLGDVYTPIMGILAEYVDPLVPESLCGLSTVALIMVWADSGFVVCGFGTGTPPMVDVYYGDRKLFTLGTGIGEEAQEVAVITKRDYDAMELDTMWFWPQAEIFKQGRQPYHGPTGKITEAPIPYSVCGDQCDDDMAWNVRRTYWDLEDPITFTWRPPNPQIMLTMKCVEYDDRGFQNWWPWGSIDVYGREEDGEWQNLSNNYPDIICQPGKLKYCLENENCVGEIMHLMATQKTTTVWACCERSQVGHPNDKKECTDHRHPCLWILDRYSDQDD